MKKSLLLVSVSRHSLTAYQAIKNLENYDQVMLLTEGDCDPADSLIEFFEAKGKAIGQINFARLMASWDTAMVRQILLAKLGQNQYRTIHYHDTDADPLTSHQIRAGLRDTQDKTLLSFSTFTFSKSAYSRNFQFRLEDPASLHPINSLNISPEDVLDITGVDFIKIDPEKAKANQPDESEKVAVLMQILDELKYQYAWIQPIKRSYLGCWTEPFLVVIIPGSPFLWIMKGYFGGLQDQASLMQYELGLWAKEEIGVFGRVVCVLEDYLSEAFILTKERTQILPVHSPIRNKNLREGLLSLPLYE